MKPLIDPAFWSDPDVERQKSGVKLSALWLMTNSQTSLLGVCGASDQRFTFETGLQSEALQGALEGLPRAFIRVGNVIFVRNYIRHQFGSGDKLIRNNFFVALRSLFNSVKDEALRVEILKEYPEFQEGLTKGLPSPRTVKERKEGESEGIDLGGNPTEEQFIAECELYSIPAFYARDKFLAKDEKGWGRKWRQHAKRVSEWYVNDGRPSKPNGNGKPEGGMFVT